MYSLCQTHGLVLRVKMQLTLHMYPAKGHSCKYRHTHSSIYCVCLPLVKFFCPTELCCARQLPLAREPGRGPGSPGPRAPLHRPSWVCVCAGGAQVLSGKLQTLPGKSISVSEIISLLHLMGTISVLLKFTLRREHSSKKCRS
jgi:hypothetical protein